MNSRIAEELLRLNGDTSNRPATTLGTVRFFFEPSREAAEVLRRVAEVLVALDRQALATWPTIDEWQRVLPRWFVEACAPEMTEVECAEYLAKWRTMTEEARTSTEANARWSLSDWLHWMAPERRTWWWSGGVEETPAVTVQIDEWPFSSGALGWLIRAAGARRIWTE